ncbi:MAG: DUF1345 domain-containing protein [Salinibacterium sp.]|nr:MAG: DUF1345 domain-containing protein [Salinibacterium sp.]
MNAKQPPAARMEHRFPALLLTLVVLSLYVVLPNPVTFLPPWLIPLIALIVLTPIVLANPRRLSRETSWSRWAGVAFAVGLATLNQAYIVLTIVRLINGKLDGPSVLLTALGVWITDVIAFALVYWEIDKGGPVARRIGGLRDDAQRDFRFPQQDEDDYSGPPWHPSFFDYAYFSLSNMMAFSPTDAMPLTLRAKGLMAYQALTGFVILALVISRAVNILT